MSDYISIKNSIQHLNDNDRLILNKDNNGTSKELLQEM